MTRPLVTCQCARWPDSGPCKWKATAEDFLCDHCRDGKCSLMGINGRPLKGHWKVESIDFISVSIPQLPA